MIQYLSNPYQDELPAFVRHTITSHVFRSAIDALRSTGTSMPDFWLQRVTTKIIKNVWYNVGTCIRDYLPYVTCGVDSYPFMQEIIYGCHDAHLLALFDWRRTVEGQVEKTERMAGRLELAKSCGWIIPTDRVCYASERPTTLKLDDDGRAHCDDGPAIIYPSGWPVYVHHGVAILEKLVMNPTGMTFQELQDMTDEELKIAIEKLGLDGFLAAEGTPAGAWNEFLWRVSNDVMES